VFITQIWWVPERSLWNTILAPSGEYVGKTLMAVLSVSRRRLLPSTAAVTMAAVNRGRCPRPHRSRERDPRASGDHDVAMSLGRTRFEVTPCHGSDEVEVWSQHGPERTWLEFASNTLPTSRARSPRQDRER
jgi:hypothetical protein